ncbi:MAG: ECF-type sigma factor, partial [Acidobacteriota bacterium]
ALDEMMPLVYRQLKTIAAGLMRRERDGNTLVSTALVHETYMRLADLDGVDWNDRSHFFALCSRIMRRVLVDHARAHNREKRGGNAQRVDTSELLRLDSSRSPDLVALDDALSALAEHDPQLVEIVELRFFGGLEREAIAQVMEMSSATVTRRWRTARAWLIHELSGALP